MKKTVVLAMTFVMVFGVTLGFVLTFNENAHAFDRCTWQCEFRTLWTHDTGTLCPCHAGSTAIYYVYRQSTCLGGPLNCQYVKRWMGCWNGEVQIAQMCVF
jgi:hypothetical protein